MSVRAAMARKTRIHQTQTVEKLRPRTERTAYPGDSGTLMQRERCRHVQYLVHLRFRRLRHAATGICRKRFEISARPLGIQYAERERRFARTGHARYAYDLSKRHVYIDILKIVDPRAADPYMICHTLSAAPPYRAACLLASTANARIGMPVHTHCSIKQTGNQYA